VLTSPADASEAADLRPAFDWEDVPNATGYTIQVSRNNLFTLLVFTANSTSSSYIHPVNLPANVSLYWRVFANGTNGPSAPSPVWSIHNANPPSVPVLTLPAANALATDYTPLFRWNPVVVPVGASFGHYQLQVDNDPAFSSPEVDDVSLIAAASSQIESPVPLTPNTKFYWRVKAFNADNESIGWSAVGTFRTALTSPVLTSPTHGATVLILRPTLDWNDVPGATNYTIQVSTSSTFTTALVNTTVTPSTFAPATALPSGYVIYWRVRTNGTNGPSDWSPVFILMTP
jgi:hypothetical protein